MTKEQLLNDTKKYKYISFDLFDTLMFRTFQEPDDVFEAVEYQYNSQNGNKKIKNFKKIRHDTEVALRNKYGEKEITIDEIYELLPFDKLIRNSLQELEKKIEIQNCVPNVAMIDFLYTCQKREQKIIITTDMYLDNMTIMEILKKIGVQNYRLYLSSQYGTTKKVGKLYEIVLNDLKIQNNEIAHIGDNRVSDILNSKKYGIKAFERIKEENEIMYYRLRNDIISSNHFNTMCIEKGRSVKDREFRLGYNVVGPLVVEFCKWTYKKKLENNIEKILFVSREGYLIYEVFKKMYPDMSKDIEYVHVNKNILRFPFLYMDTSCKQFLKTIPNRNEYTVEEILNDFFIDDKIRFMELTDIKLKLDDKIKKQGILSGQYDEIFEKIFNALKDEFKQQYELFAQYIRSLNVENKKIFLVNNSINGNGQIMLETLLEALEYRTKITGIQFVASRKCKEILDGRYMTWITCEKGIKNRYYAMEFNRYALLLEHLMFASTGTALYFENKYDEVRVVFHRQGKEENNNYLINNIQKYALQYAHDGKDYGEYELGRKSIELIRQLFRYPYSKDIDILNKIYDCDADGEKKLIDAMNWKQAYENKKSKHKLLNICDDCYDYTKAIVSLIKEKKEEILGENK